MIRRSDIWPLALILVLGAAYQSVFLHFGVGLIDEGHLANAARRIAGGEVLYRDVYSVYPPASFYLVSMLFEIFGTSLSVVRLFHVVLTVGLAGVVYLFGRTFVSRAWACGAGLLVAMTGWEAIVERLAYGYLYSFFPFVALALLFRMFETETETAKEKATQTRQLLCVGVFVGLTLLFRLVPFAGVSLAIAVVLLLRQGRGAFRSLAVVAIGATGVLLPCFVWFADSSALGDLFRAVFWTSYAQYLGGGEFNLPFPPLSIWPEGMSRADWRMWWIAWEFRIPILVYAIVLAEAGWRIVRTPRPVEIGVLARLAVAIFGSILFFRATGRSDYYHLAPVLAPAYLLGMDLLSRSERWVPVKGRSIFGGCVVASVILGSVLLHEVDLAGSQALNADGRVEIASTGAWVPEAGGLDDLVREIQARASEEESIVVLPWYPIVYFLAERANPTRFDWLFPGYLEDAEATRAFITQIDESEAKLVVYDPTPIDGRRDRSLAGFAPEIDDFLRRRFSVAGRVGRFFLLERGRGTIAGEER